MTEVILTASTKVPLGQMRVPRSRPPVTPKFTASQVLFIHTASVIIFIRRSCGKFIDYILFTTTVTLVHDLYEVNYAAQSIYHSTYNSVPKPKPT